MSDLVPTPAHPSSTHRHTSRCYWDLTECRWVCPAAARVPAAGEEAQPDPSLASGMPAPLPT